MTLALSMCVVGEKNLGGWYLHFLIHYQLARHCLTDLKRGIVAGYSAVSPQSWQSRAALAAVAERVTKPGCSTLAEHLISFLFRLAYAGLPSGMFIAEQNV